uniref:TIR domain-containing protein n=1 Tax=uncultured Thiotrichaceae bacterium TaxID=298394 RepID=A0A6S6UKR4_9GAMM|nr:MAG: Unknown protein [uncultured Thiotrichaceae bacterium]
MPDIFVSYAHIDNQPFHEGKPGWISQFIEHLRNETSRRMGRAEHYSLWMDFRLNANDAVTPAIEKQLGDAKLLLVMMSKGWLESEWCVKELEYFCAQHPEAAQNGQIFIIDQDGLPRDEKPVITHDLLSYPFYEKTIQQQIRQLGYPLPQPNHQSYFDRLVDMSHQLATALKTPAPVFTQPANQTTSTPTVYVAPVNDSLFDQRNILISELNQYGIQALPTHNRHENDMDSTLATCSHFIQLLDDDYSQGIPFNQHFCAGQSNKPILQWHDPTLKASSNPEQQELLSGKTVIVCELSDFIRQVREAVIPKQPAEKPSLNGQADKLIFVQSSPDDFQYARQIAGNLKTQGFGIALPRYEGDAARIRKSIERGYQHCDILLVLQQRASADVVEDYLSDAQVYTRKSPPILICQCQEAEELFFMPPGVRMLPCNGSFDSDCLTQFLETEEAQ